MRGKVFKNLSLGLKKPLEQLLTVCLRSAGAKKFLDIVTRCLPSHLASSACSLSPAPASLPAPSQGCVLCSCQAGVNTSSFPESGWGLPVGKCPSHCERRSGVRAQAAEAGSRPVGRRRGSAAGRGSASLLNRRRLSKLETGEEFRGWRRAALLPSCGCLGGGQGTLPFALPSVITDELLLLCTLVCTERGHRACSHMHTTAPLVEFSRRKRCSPNQLVMPWVCVQLHGHGPACPCLGRLAVAGMLQLLISPSLTGRVSALENTMSDKGSSMEGKTDIVNGKGAGRDRSPPAWGLLLGRLMALSAPRRQLVQQPGGDVS